MGRIIRTRGVSMNRFARRLALALLLSCGVCAAHAQVVISQVYGGGGNSGATLKSDFIELHNNGSDTVSVEGWSVQYASSSGSTWQVTPLAGSIGPGGYYLVKQNDGAGGTQDLPTPDAVGTVSMSGSNGKVALSESTTALGGSCPTGNADFVRSEEHTSELQSLMRISYAVFCLKKKTQITYTRKIAHSHVRRYC